MIQRIRTTESSSCCLAYVHVEYIGCTCAHVCICVHVRVYQNKIVCDM